MTVEQSIDRKLEDARRDLLDLTTRNRLLNTNRSSTRSGRLEIVDERSDEVLRLLVTERKAMSFLPCEPPQESNDSGQVVLFQPPEYDDADDGCAEQHVDLHLQTNLSDQDLQKRLLKLYYDARTFKEEQGSNILYLALGFLKWYEDDSSDRERYAPLLLLPVDLDRRSAASRFCLTLTDDEIATNLSLQEKLKSDFGLKLPEIPDVDDLILGDYFSEVSRAIETKPRWEVCPHDIVLWFFSFSKFLMYRDLQPDTWPEESKDCGARIGQLTAQGRFRRRTIVLRRG